ncbi:MAG: Neocarzinostatin family [Ilumatobacteraceae bacterium]|nr:Neocarzinostatin family [Ilumatobacteraceae bacterium]
MADYEPFPTGANEVEDRSLKKRVLGCFGCGGLSVLGFFGVVILLIGGLGTGAGGCDTDVGDPGEGTASLRLPVDVAPRTDLADGTEVRVTSDEFDADAVVGVAVCLRAADTERRGVKACDEAQGARYATTDDGSLDATYPVPRVITVGGKAYDCAAEAERCIVVAADANDYDRSGGRAITFATGLPEVEPSSRSGRAESDYLPIGSQPAVGGGPVAAGTALTVLASGFQPDEPLLIAYCTADLEDDGVVDSCEPEDAAGAASAIMLQSVSGRFLRADASGAFTTTLPARAAIVPFGSDMGRALDAYGSRNDPTTSTSRPAGSTTTTRPPKGSVRCTATTGGCSIVIAAAADTKRSAVLPYVVSP